MYEEVVKLNKDFYKLFYKFELPLAESVVKRRGEIREKVDKMMSKAKDPNEAHALFRVRKIAELIWDMEKIQIGMFV